MCVRFFVSGCGLVFFRLELFGLFSASGLVQVQCINMTTKAYDMRILQGFNGP